MKIDDKFHIKVDNSTATLILTENRQKKDKDTKEMVDYLATEEFYYPTVNSCLVRYLSLKQGEAKDVKDCIRITEEVIKEIRKLKWN